MQRHYIFLIEHPKRELEFVRRICFELESKGQLTYIYSIHFDLWQINRHKSSIIFLPYCLSENDYPFSAISKRKGHLFINMNWEQILSPINKSVKIIKGEARNNFQFCWNLDFKEHLRKNCEIKEDLIIQSINPTSFLIRNTKVKDQFISYCSENQITKYIFFPLNYNWALMEESRRKKRIQRLDYKPEQARKYIDYSEKHLNVFLKFLNEIILNTDFRIILRPHPGISTEAYIKKIKASEFNSILKNPRFRVDNNFSAIDWIQRAELTISNWSTLIYDSWLAGYKSCYFWPEDIPEFINAYHTEEPQKISSINEIDRIKNINQKDLDQSFTSLISNILEIKNISITQEFKCDTKLISRLKKQRSLMRYILLKLKLRKLINPILLLDYFESNNNEFH